MADTVIWHLLSQIGRMFVLKYAELDAGVTQANTDHIPTSLGTEQDWGAYG